MPFQLQPFADVGLDEPLLRLLIDEHDSLAAPEYARLWAYYRNPREAATPALSPASSGWPVRTRLAQERGLPPRLRRERDALADDRARPAREVVIENDIGWRIHAMVDFMLGRPLALASLAPDEQLRLTIDRILDAVLEASGGSALLHDMALLAAVHGHVDLLLRADALFDAAAPNVDPSAPLDAGANADRADPERASDRALDFARLLRIELVEAPRAIPLLSPHDFRRLDALIIRFTRPDRAIHEETGLRRLAAALARFAPGAPGSGASRRRAETEIIEVLSASRRQVYEDAALIEDAPNPLGELPVVHIQNVSQPFRYPGLSEVEPLIPLQDELNTRMSDRAHRVTMQSFKMYLARGMEGFGAAAGAPMPIGPGQIWSTDNTEASVEAFGGDAASPSEDAHIEQVRQALDKASGVTPVAAGVIRAKVGQLSSESALRVTLMGMLARTARKQVAFGRGLAELARLILLALDRAGVLPTEPDDRAVRVRWPDPLPRNEKEVLEAALLKQQLGVPQERILAELGYAPQDSGVT